MDRSAQPIWIYAYETGAAGEDVPVCNADGECFENRLNAFMDHCWDGFYTCQQREQRFPTMVYQNADTYWVEYTGTPPEKQKFVLHAAAATGFKVRIKYSNAGAYAIYDASNRVVEPTEWDDATEDWADLPRQRCGENRYIGVTNVLEFFITPGCPLTIMPRDAIMLGVRLEFTMDEFFATGGVVSFVDRMAASLGIHKADIRVVAVYEGSTIIDFQIISNLLDDEPLDLEVVKETFEAVVSTMDTFMGSPVLNAVSTGKPIITPNTVLDPDGGIAGGGGFDFGFGLDDDEDEEEEKEPETVVEFRYREEVKAMGEDAAAAAGYIVIIVLITIIILLVIAAVALYRKLGTHTRVSKKEVPEGVRTQPEFSSMSQLDDQYDPKKDFAAEGFGGIRFDRSSTRKKEKIADAVASRMVPGSEQPSGSGGDTDRRLHDEESNVRPSIGLADSPNRFVDSREVPASELDRKPKRKGTKNYMHKR